MTPKRCALAAWAGIIATDPINADAAQWLKAELARRFNQPIKYLIYSHDHADHIAGGQLFADTALVVAHENAKAAIVGEKRPTAVVRMYRQYMEDLRGEVLRYAREGKSLDEMKQLIKMPGYEKWAGYQHMLPLNIEGMYRQVHMHRRPNP